MLLSPFLFYVSLINRLPLTRGIWVKHFGKWNCSCTTCNEVIKILKVLKHFLKVFLKQFKESHLKGSFSFYTTGVPKLNIYVLLCLFILTRLIRFLLYTLFILNTYVCESIFSIDVET